VPFPIELDQNISHSNPHFLFPVQHASAEKAYTDAAAAQKETEAGIANTDKEIKSISGALQQKKKDAAAARDQERVRSVAC
jgi:hypothetical protein